VTSLRDGFGARRIYVVQEMTIALAVPDILVARAKSGDLEALEALYRAFETPVYNLALRVLRAPEDAEDVLQETFLEVVRSIKQYRGEGHLWGWIRQIATSKALMRIRHDRVRETEELHEESGVGGMGWGAGATRGMSPSVVPAQIDLERAFERLSETSRAVVWLHDVEGYTHEEIAEQMGKTVSFSKSQLARAHVRLRRMLGEGVSR
jgi:RNA polymerase sigma-70 factor (ECF subfamily)